MTRPMTQDMTQPVTQPVTLGALRGLARVHTISAGADFAGALARGVMARYGTSPEALPACRIFLPTRRACRVVREAFLRLTGGVPLLLPRLQPLGDVDADEVSIHGAALEGLDLPAPMSALRRQILLTRVILSQPEGLARTPEQAVALAGALGDLLDRIQTEGLDIRNLAGLAGEAFAAHWQVTLDFLKIISEHWPAVLAADGSMDPAARRDAMTRVMTRLWREAPPAGPVIAAGSTGSIPATADFLETIARLPDGCVVLPGLDTCLDEASWEALEDTHPQAALKGLLARMGVRRSDVMPWEAGVGLSPSDGTSCSENSQEAVRFVLAREIMRPAATSAFWKNMAGSPEGGGLDGAFTGLWRHDCDTPQEEAAVIATIFRETLGGSSVGHDPGHGGSSGGERRRMAALATPDRGLARRVAALCRRWGIAVDDSGGTPLVGTSPVRFLRLAFQAALEGLTPVPLLALLRHELCAAGMEGAVFRHAVRALDRAALRGLRPASGFSGLQARVAQRVEESALSGVALTRVTHLLTRLEPAFDPLLALAEGGGEHPFGAWLEAHLRCAEGLAAGVGVDGALRLWAGEAGSAAADFLSELRESAGFFPPLTGQAYAGVLDQLMRSVTVRPAWGTHPRLAILGQIEARMVAADVVVLGGLNEGVWPGDPGHDPWMSRPMRAAFGLPSPEREIGFAAHDFVQGFCAPTVHLTRSVRAEGAPTVPARWLQRLDVVMQAAGHDPAAIRTRRYKHYAKHMDRPDSVRPVTRPAPCPPVACRPTRISVTRVETLLSDPYSIYARDILRLRALEPLDKTPDEADRGTILHAVLEGFVRDFPESIPPDAAARIMTRARAEMIRRSADPAVWSVWMRRMERIAQGFVDHERARRGVVGPLRTEARGESVFQIAGREIVLSAIADRIDRTREGRLVLVDYKSGGAYTTGKIRSGALAQLPLEALILHRGGFEGLSGVVAALEYWKLTGRENEPIEIISLSDGPEVSVATLADQARVGFEALMAAFSDPATPYYSLPRLDRRPRYNDYEHLARVTEWSAPGEIPEAA